jgi:hypothetical protein
MFKSLIKKRTPLYQFDGSGSNAFIWKIDAKGEPTTDSPFLSGCFKNVGQAIKWLEEKYPVIDCAGFRLVGCFNPDNEDTVVEYYF